MSKFPYALAIACALVLVIDLPFANAQAGHPMADKVADKVIARFQSSSCEQIAAKRSQPPTPDEARNKERAAQLMRNDPELRTYILNKVAGPIANKLFECGMIP